MNKKRWIVVGIAILLLVASGISSIGLGGEGDGQQSSTWESLNPYAMILGNQEPQPEIIEAGDPNNQILVIPIEGAIGMDGSGYQHELILSAIEQASLDDTIKAVLLDIDSPGGQVYHTHEVYSELMSLKEEVDMPIYASMRSMAASGGYYLAMPADTIFAGPNTVTGSIGVIMSNYDVSELMDEYGIRKNVIKSGEMKDILSASRSMTDEEEQVLQDYVDESFDEFIAVIDENRDNLDEGQIRELADGRIYSGRQALEHGLVDELGYFNEALESLRQAEGLEDAQVFQYTQANSFDVFSGFPFGKQTNAPNLIQELEEAQEVKIEYRWEGAPVYGG